MTRWPAALVVLPALLALMLAGCSVRSVATETSQGLPERYIAGDNLFNGEPLALWAGGGLAVVTFGSSSCPPVPTSISAPDPERIVVQFAPSPNEQCTADLAPTTHQFDLPDGVEAVGGVTAELRFEQQTYEVPVE
jgi:hypothetical protein